MREILFRGKRIDSGAWVEGFLLEQDSQEYHAYIVKAFKAEMDNRHMDILECDMQEVDPSTVGQHTGLTDKNGQKIFEGDIVDILTENEEIGVVAYDDGGFLVNADGFCVDFHSNINGTDLEIIGNIHDNPELLGGDRNVCD